MRMSHEMSHRFKATVHFSARKQCKTQQDRMHINITHKYIHYAVSQRDLQIFVNVSRQRSRTANPLRPPAPFATYATKREAEKVPLPRSRDLFISQIVIRKTTNHSASTRVVWLSGRQQNNSCQFKSSVKRDPPSPSEEKELSPETSSNFRSVNRFCSWTHPEPHNRETRDPTWKGKEQNPETASDARAPRRFRHWALNGFQSCF